jgi:glycosyltransferase involved in cell wall biosynthesis
MHVLAAARSLPCHSIGGMQAIAWDVLTGLARLGHRVTVLTTDVPGRRAAFEESGVMVVPLVEAPAEKYSSRWWRASRRAATERCGTRVDAVLSISTAAAGLIPLKRSIMRVPFIYQAHGSSWGEAVSKWKSVQPVHWAKSAKNLYWLMKDATIYRGFDQLVFVGDALRRQFEAAPLRWITPGIAKTVINNGVDTERFRFDPAARASVRARLGFSERDRVVTFASRLHPQKGAAVALRALKILHARDADFRLLLIGGGPQENELRQLARELKLTSLVAFSGAVGRSEVPAFLSAGDCFAFPTLGHEGLPLNVLEALSIGLPCVASDHVRPVFGPDLPITYVPANEPRALADALQRVTLHGVPERSLLPPPYSLRHCVDAYGSLLEQLVNR